MSMILSYSANLFPYQVAPMVIGLRMAGVSMWVTTKLLLVL